MVAAGFGALAAICIVSSLVAKTGSLGAVRFDTAGIARTRFPGILVPARVRWGFDLGLRGTHPVVRSPLATFHGQEKVGQQGRGARIIPAACFALQVRSSAICWRWRTPSAAVRRFNVRARQGRRAPREPSLNRVSCSLGAFPRRIPGSKVVREMVPSLTSSAYRRITVRSELAWDVSTFVIR